MAIQIQQEIWKHPNFRELSTNAKLIYFYLIFNCDIAGFMTLDEGLISFQTGLDSNEVSDSLNELKTLNEIIISGNRLFFRSHIFILGNENLSSTNLCHKGIIKRLKSNLPYFQQSEEYKGFLAPYKPLISPDSSSNSNSSSNN